MFFYTFLPKLLNMSLTASVVIVFVLLLRLLLKKAPKVISYALWSVVLVRLLCPVSIGSDFSLFGLLNAPVAESGALTSRIEYVPSNFVHTEYPAIVLPVPGIDDAINDALPQGEEQTAADPLEAPLAIATYVWMAGLLAMGIYAAVSYIRLRRKLITASPLRDTIYLADEITSPFVMGFFKPKIYLPSSLEEREQSYILMHEQHHIRRFDHIIKALAFAALCIHWFNPLVWVAFIMAGKDMEMSCDEAVVKKMGTGVLADYTASLLSLATGTPIIAGKPLGFGEGDAKGRIRNLAHWKKPAFGVVLAAVIACVVFAVVFTTNPKKATTTEDALAQLESSVTWEGASVSFTIPPYDAGEWYIHVSGRAVYDDGFSQSLHYLENESWLTGKTYTIQPDSSAVELILVAAIADPANGEIERTIDLLQGKSADVQLWFDELESDELNLDGRQEINLDAFPGVTFRYAQYQIIAESEIGHTILMEGMPIWNAYFTDLTGDGLPELCATISVGSDIVDDRVVIYDYANAVSYSLEDRGEYDYRLSMQNGQLDVPKQVYNSSEIVETGYLAYADDTIQIVPIAAASEASSIAFSANLAGNTSFQQKMVLTASTPYGRSRSITTESTQCLLN